MVSTLRVEDRLEGATNFRAWKARILLLLEENDLKDYVEMVIPDPNDAQELAAHKKKEVKAKWVLLDSVKDHLIPHISEKKTTKDMYDALVGLYQSGNAKRKLILRHKLRSVEMSKSNIVASYLMRITQIRDQLVAIGEAVDDTELVNVALNGFLGSWEPFVQGICAREKLPPFDRLWIDCIQEEAQIESKNGKQRGSDDENQALAAHARKGRGNGSPRREASPE
jgi:hypothetical protein